MGDKRDIFFGEDPFQIFRRWFEESVKTEINDPDAIALSTVDSASLSLSVNFFSRNSGLGGSTKIYRASTPSLLYRS